MYTCTCSCNSCCMWVGSKFDECDERIIIGTTSGYWSGNSNWMTQWANGQTDKKIDVYSNYK